MIEIRGGIYAYYKDELVWVANVGGKKGMALIVFNVKPNIELEPKAEWVEVITLSTKRRET